MPETRREPTAAFGYPDLQPGAMRPLAAMAHIMMGFQRNLIGWARERAWVTPKSAHFSISRTGDVVQHLGVYHSGELERIVKRDVALTYRMLRFANAAAHGDLARATAR